MCACMRALLCLGLNKVWQMKLFFIFFIFLQLIRLWLQVCEEKGGSEKEMLARGLLLTPVAPPEVRTPGH